MLVWRLARRAYRKLDGKGAEAHGGRWNSEGVAVVYTSSTLALAALEVLVHLDADEAPGDLLASAIEVPDDAKRESVTPADLPEDWARVPDHPACREIGDRWAAERRSLVLGVPSVLAPEELNYLINPLHPRAGAVRAASTRQFAFDPRLISAGRSGSGRSGGPRRR